MNINIEESLEKAREINQKRIPVSPRKLVSLKNDILDLMHEKKAVMVCHYYVDGVIQDFAVESGGIVADSLEMAKFGKKTAAETLIVVGVRFMGETAKILSPEKKVIMPTLKATCSLDVGCDAALFKKFCEKYPEKTVVVYANTSAAVKASADWTVTSSCAVKIIEYLKSRGDKIIFAPDKHLGSYLKKTTGADITNWDGHCVVHDEFKAFELMQLKKRVPEASVVVHPESPASVIDLADFVGSTSEMIKYVIQSDSKKIIVGTDNGLIHMMKKKAPEKIYLEAPTAGNGASCKSCAHCPWMEMNDLRDIFTVLKTGNNEIQVESKTAILARKSIQRMLDFQLN